MDAGRIFIFNCHFYTSWWVGEVAVIRGDAKTLSWPLCHSLQLVGAMVADVMLNHVSSLYHVIIIRASGNNTWYLYLLHIYLDISEL